MGQGLPALHAKSNNFARRPSQANIKNNKNAKHEILLAFYNGINVGPQGDRKPQTESPSGTAKNQFQEAANGTRIKAINAYRPRIDQGNTVQKPELIRAVSRATGIVEGTLDQNIKEVRDQLIEFLRTGRAVKVEGLGTWTPTISLDGTLEIQYRPDSSIGYGLNIPNVFSGTIINRENIGKTPEELIQIWNEAHPEDLVPPEED